MTGQISHSVVAVVVTYNRLEKLKKTVGRLLEEAPDLLKRLIVCDNASNDGTHEWLASIGDARLTVITLDENIGGSGGFETGLRFAIDSGDEAWFLLMDDDAFPEAGTLKRFCKRDRSEAEVWLASVRYPDGKICEMNRPWHNPFSSIRVFVKSLLKGHAAFHLDDEAYQNDEIMMIDGGSFVGQFVSRTALKSVGFPRGDLFIYADDVLFTLAVRDAGYPIAFDPNLLFVHDCESIEAEANTMAPIWKVYFYYRNLSFVYRKVAGPVLYWPVIGIKFMRWRLKARHYGPNKSAYIKLLNLAIKDAFAKRTGNKASDIQALINSPES